MTHDYFSEMQLLLVLAYLAHEVGTLMVLKARSLGVGSFPLCYLNRILAMLQFLFDEVPLIRPLGVLYPTVTISKGLVSILNIWMRVAPLSVPHLLHPFSTPPPPARTNTA